MAGQNIVPPRFACVLLFGMYFIIAATHIIGVEAHAQQRWQSQVVTVVNGTDYIQVPLLEFKISIEFQSTSSPDILYYALADYLLNCTAAR